MLDLAKFIGMSKTEAISQLRKLGYSPRVIKDNGKIFDPPLEYIPKLVNLTVRDGIITRAELEEIEF